MTNDHVIALLQQAIAELSMPASWTPITDRMTRPKPAPLPLGPAGFAFVDPVFGAKLWRVTDEKTSSGKSCRMPSNAAVSAWNADSTTFAIIDESMNVVIFQVGNDGVPTQLPAVVGGYTEPAFSYLNPRMLYRVGGHNSLIVQVWDLSANTHLDVVDLTVKFPALPLTNTYANAIVTDGDSMVVLFGGAAADLHHYVWHSTTDRLLDTLVLPVPFHIHGMMQERSGRYVLLGPTQPDITAGVAKLWIWDMQVNVVTPITKLAGGHCAAGYGELINQDCCTSSSYDGLQYQRRTFVSPDVTHDLFTDADLPSPKEVFIADHANWRAARPDVVVPFATATFRESGDPTPWRAWDDEVLLIHPITKVVQRICHHQAVHMTGDFWEQPMLHVSPDGKHATFTSNWDGTLGGRQDVFLVSLI
jgi:hypothetical protein